MKIMLKHYHNKKCTSLKFQIVLKGYIMYHITLILLMSQLTKSQNNWFMDSCVSISESWDQSISSLFSSLNRHPLLLEKQFEQLILYSLILKHAQHNLTSRFEGTASVCTKTVSLLESTYQQKHLQFIPNREIDHGCAYGTVCLYPIDRRAASSDWSIDDLMLAINIMCLWWIVTLNIIMHKNRTRMKQFPYTNIIMLTKSAHTYQRISIKSMTLILSNSDHWLEFNGMR